MKTEVIPISGNNREGIAFDRTPTEKMSVDSDGGPQAPNRLRRMNWPWSSRNMPQVTLFHDCKFTKGYEM